MGKIIKKQSKILVAMMLVVTLIIPVGNTLYALPEDATEALVAIDFSVSLDKVADLTSEEAVDIALAEAWTVPENEHVDVEADPDMLEDLQDVTEVGSYDMDFVTESGLRRTVKAHVTEGGGFPVIEDGIAIDATDFFIDVDDVEGVTDSELIKKAKATAWVVETNERVEVTEVENALEVECGVYPVTFGTDAGLSITVRGMVYEGNNPIVDYDTNEFIDAMDFGIEIEEVADLNVDKLFELTKAKAFDINSGEKVEIVKFDIEELTSLPDDKYESRGSYNVFASTEKGTEKPIISHVGPNIEFLDDSSLVISSEDAIIISTYEMLSILNSAPTVDKKNAIVDKTIVNQTNALSWENEEDKLVAEYPEIEVLENDFNALEPEPGKYSATLNSNAKLSDEDKSIVSNRMLILTALEDEISEDGTEIISANPFGILASDVESLTDEKVIELAKAKAFILEDGTELPITVDYSAILPVEGYYEVIFSTEAGTSVSVNAFVGESNKPEVIEDMGIVVFASDYSMSYEEFIIGTVSDHVKASNAYALDLDTLEEVEIEGAIVKHIEGSAYETTFVIDSKPVITVDLTVIGEAPPTPTDPTLPTTGNQNMFVFAAGTLLVTLGVKKRSKTNK